MCFWHADQGKINKLWLVFVSLSFQPAVWACVTLLCHKYCVKLQQFFFKKLFDFLPGIPEPSSNSFRDPIPSLKISANFGLCSCPSFLFINFHRRNKCLLLSSVYYISLLKVSYFLPQRDFALIFFPPNGKKKVIYLSEEIWIWYSSMKWHLSDCSRKDPSVIPYSTA